MEHPLGTRLAAEALGTFLFFFLGFSGIAVSVDIGIDAIGPLGIAFGFGLGLALAITAFGHISGGHYNPAVSAGLAIAGKFPSRDVVPYWIAQLVGGFGAVLVMAIVYSKAVTNALGHESGQRHRRLGRTRSRDHRDRTLRHGDPHRRHGRPRGLEGRHGAAAHRPLHLHRRDDGRPCLRWIVQPRAFARPGPLQPGLGERVDLHRRPARRRCTRRSDLDVPRRQGRKPAVA